MTIDVKFAIDRGNFSLKFDISIPSQGVTAIFGPSGCGKTSLLRMIAGLDHIPNAYLNINGQCWQDGQYFLAPHKRSIGYVFQEPSLFSHLTIQQNLEYGLKRLKTKSSLISLTSTIELLAIGHLLTRKPQQLSGGEQQRVAIARALVTSPDILLLDEPLAALDHVLKEEILPYLESLQDTLDIPILYVSHSRNEVARLADHMLLLKAGRIEASGSVNHLFARLDLDLAHDSATETLISAIVVKHDDDFQLSHLHFSGGCFYVARSPLAVGSHARLQIFARDVSITLEKQSNTSILNIFPARVDKMVNEGNTQITLRLMIGSIPVLARITRKSAHDLGLHQGKAVFAQIKSVALLS